MVGFAAGQGIPEVKVNRLLLNNVDVRGVGWGAYAMVRPGYMQEQWQALVPMIEAGVVKPPIGATYELEEFGRALVDMDERRTLGKSVVRVPMNPAHRQLGAPGPVRLGADRRRGDRRRAPTSRSWSTCSRSRPRSCVAVERGMTVLPYLWKDERAAAYAETAVGRARGRPARGACRSPTAPASASRRPPWPASPASTGSCCRRRTAPRSAFGLADSGCTVVGACLRNRAAVARWLQARGGTVAVVAAGERWPDGSLRPCAEDLWGAGAVLAPARPGARPRRPRRGSPPTRSARSSADPRRALRACASGLRAGGGRLRARTSTSPPSSTSADVVPVLDDGEFRAATD